MAFTFISFDFFEVGFSGLSLKTRQILGYKEIFVQVYFVQRVLTGAVTQWLDLAKMEYR